jgi:chaperonin cofactor prefoldin
MPHRGIESKVESLKLKVESLKLKVESLKLKVESLKSFRVEHGNGGIGYT